MVCIIAYLLRGSFHAHQRKRLPYNTTLAIQALDNRGYALTHANAHGD
jgi:hypothetical protein